jgi:hypothetical protein
MTDTSSEPLAVCYGGETVWIDPVLRRLYAERDQIAEDKRVTVRRLVAMGKRQDELSALIAQRKREQGATP